jgi:hypothetical protein
MESALCAIQMAVHLFRCVSSMLADSLCYHFGKEGSRAFAFDKVLQCINISQLSPVYAQETQLTDCERLGPWCVVFE